MNEDNFCIGILLIILALLLTALIITTVNYNADKESYCINRFSNNVLEYKQCKGNTIIKTINSEVE